MEIHRPHTQQANLSHHVSKLRVLFLGGYHPLDRILDTGGCGGSWLAQQVEAQLVRSKHEPKTPETLHVRGGPALQRIFLLPRELLNIPPDSHMVICLFTIIWAYYFFHTSWIFLYVTLCQFWKHCTLLVWNFIVKNIFIDNGNTSFTGSHGCMYKHRTPQFCLLVGPSHAVT